MTKRLAVKLVKLRTANNFSGPEAADKLGIEHMTLSRWERAKSYPDTESLVKLANLYGVPPEELTTIVEDELAYSDSAWGSFPYPTIILVLYICYGYFTGNWHPAWLVFLTVPLYRRIGEYFLKSKKQ